MWLLLLLLLSFAHIEPVNLQDNFRLFLRSKENPCEGHVEVQYQNQWGYVGDKYWDNNTEAVVCRSTHCGETVKETSDVRRSMKRKVLLNELKCTGEEENLWDCDDWPGPGVSYYQKPTVKKIKCSNKIKIRLNKHRCEGAVQYLINEQPTGYICSDNFGDTEAAHLCDRLKCGGVKGRPNHKWMTGDKGVNTEYMKINCSGIDFTNLWQCASEKAKECQPATVTCDGHNKLQLRGNRSNVCSGKLEKFNNSKWEPFEIKTSEANKVCEQMHCGKSGTFNVTDRHLTCSDSVQVVLKDRNVETKCFGEVNIKVNGTSKPVCASSWTDKDAEMVCAELNCGKMMKNDKKPLSTPSGIMDHLKCEGESSLWHCGAQRGNALKCSSSPYVICSESIEVNLVDGPGKCAGKLSIKYENEWTDVSSAGWTTKHSDVVCKQLRCGQKSSRSTLKFKNGAGKLLSMKCDPNVIQDISECIDANPTSRQTDSAPPVGITCEEHKVVFLDGPRACSGTVGIEQGDRTFWLSGSNETWNQQAANIVCQQLQCGNASSFTSEPVNGQTSVAYSCSSNEKSLFECDKTSLPDYNRTIARVECEAQGVQLGLTGGCWGFVNMSAAGRSGGVCADTWTDDMSNRLCKELGCGDAILNKYGQRGTGTTAFRNFHAKIKASTLSRYSFELTEDGDRCYHDRAYVVCKGSVKPRFGASRDSCSGNVQVELEGKWLPVCKESLDNDKTRTLICRELNCGAALNVIDYFGPAPEVNNLIKIQTCSGNLSSCEISEETAKGICKPGALQCSDWKKMALEVEHACEGAVTVYSKGSSEDTRRVLSSEGWTKEEGETLCKNMNCGNFIENYTLDATEDDTFWERTFKCSGTESSVWECDSHTTPKPSDNKKLCVRCKDKSKVTLSGTCFGEVKINEVPVCASQWKTDYSHRVCQELGCGNAIDIPIKVSPATPEEKYYVYCDEHNYILGQCKRVKGKCPDPVSISCTGSVSFTTTEKCGGDIQIKYGDKEEKLCDANIPDKLSSKLCKEINCDSEGAKIEQGTRTQSGHALETTLDCPSYYNDFKHCVKNKSCGTSPPSRIRCADYVPPSKPPESAPPTNPVPIIVGVGIFLILVILIVIFVRYRSLMRTRKFRAPSSTQEAEWDSEEYDDIEQADEIEDISRDRFRSESEFMKEKDVDSMASVSYDDIDEVAEAQPLTPPGVADDAPKDAFICEGVADLKDDGVTYEVDDEQENYDEIVEVKETSAQVHDGLKAAPERVASALPDPEQRDDDYVDPSYDE